MAGDLARRWVTCPRAAAAARDIGDTLAPGDGVVLPLRYRYGDQELAMFSISAAVGTATDVTVEELAIESFYPADATTAATLRRARPARPAEGASTTVHRTR